MSTAIPVDPVTLADPASGEHGYSGDDKSSIFKRIQTLGTVQSRHALTNEIILVPTPSNDPNDPLNWSVGNSIFGQMLLTRVLGVKVSNTGRHL